MQRGETRRHRRRDGIRISFSIFRFLPAERRALDARPDAEVPALATVIYSDGEARRATSTIVASPRLVHPRPAILLPSARGSSNFVWPLAATGYGRSQLGEIPCTIGGVASKAPCAQSLHTSTCRSSFARSSKANLLACVAAIDSEDRRRRLHHRHRHHIRVHLHPPSWRRKHNHPRSPMKRSLSHHPAHSPSSTKPKSPPPPRPADERRRKEACA